MPKADSAQAFLGCFSLPVREAIASEGHEQQLGSDVDATYDLRSKMHPSIMSRHRGIFEILKQSAAAQHPLITYPRSGFLLSTVSSHKSLSVLAPRPICSLLL